MPLKARHLEDFDHVIEQGDCCGKSSSLLLMPGCHPNAPALASYLNGAVTLRCSRCRKMFTKIAVASRKDG